MNLKLRILVTVVAIFLALATAVALYAFQIKQSGIPANLVVRDAKKSSSSGLPAITASAFTKIQTAKNGNLIARIYAEPVRFADAHGKWEDIDTSIKNNGSALAPKAAGFELKFGTAYGTPLRMARAGSEITFSPSENSGQEAEITGSTAVYRNVFAGTDLARTVTASGVKESYILNGAGHPTSFLIVLNTNTEARLEADGSLGYYRDGIKAATSPAPYLVDDKGKRMRVEYRMAGNTISIILPDAAAGLTYPITVDPTTYFVSDAADGYIGYDGDGVAYIHDGEPQLEAASDAGIWVANAWLRFPIDGLSGTIVSATLGLNYYNRSYTTGAQALQIDHVSDFGFLDETDWAAPPLQAGIDGSPLASSAPYGWHIADVKTSVQDDVNNFRSSSSYRLSVIGNGNWYARFRSAESTFDKPYLRVEIAPNNTALRSAIAEPADQTYIRGVNYTITGTASPANGGPELTKVDVSTDGGTTWNTASGTADWSYTWALPADGTYVIKTRADDGTPESPGPGARITVDNTPPVVSITSPPSGQTVDGGMTISGTVTDQNLDLYTLAYGKGSPPGPLVNIGSPFRSPVSAGVLGAFNTLRLTNETYTFVLTAIDKAGNFTPASLPVIVSNSLRPSSPHGNYQLDSDLCALCHGTHAAIAAPGILRFGATKYQSQLCYTCHGGGAGAETDVAAEFDTHASHHPIKDVNYDLTDPQHTLDCSDCHDAHGSEEINGKPYPRLLRAKAKDGTGTKSYSGNAFCYSCHGQAGLIKNIRYFETSNAHNNTDPGQIAQFPDPGSGTKIKCSGCHAAHGSSDPRLRLASDKVLCGTCHPDTPYTLRVDNEIVTSLGYPGGWTEPTYAGIRVFSQDTFNTPPVGLKGPKEYRVPPQSFSPIDIGLDIGDATNDGKADVVQTIGFATNSLAVFTQDASGYGLKTPLLFSGKGGFGVAIGDVAGNDLLNEVVVAGPLNNLKVMTIMGETIVSSTEIASGGTGLRGIAIGDVDADGDNDVVVANYNSNSISFFKQATGTLTLDQTFASGGLKPLDVAIGDVNNDGKNEVVVVNVNYGNPASPPYPDDNIAVFTQSGGNLVLSATFSNGPATVGTDVAIGDVLSGRAGNEILCVGHQMDTANNAQGDLTVINIPSGSSSTVWTNALDSKSVATGDVDGNGSADAAVLNAGSISVFGNGFTELSAPVTYEMRGPNTVGLGYETGVIDIGNIGNLHPYGHRPEVLGTSCSAMCHDPHSVTKAAPVGGTSGIRPVYGTTTSYITVPKVEAEYQLCYKCHSAGASPMIGTRNVAEEFNPKNASFHSVMATGPRNDIPPESFVSPWAWDSPLTCRNCHDNAASGQQLSHGSVYAGMLKNPYAGVKTSNGSLLCYSCHALDFYYPASYTYPPSYTWSRDASRAGHGVHTRRGYGCPMCHDVHGSALFNGLIRPEMNIRPGASPGTFICSSDCHKS